MNALPTDTGRRRLVVGHGYLGSRVARAWLERGDRVWATTRSPARAAALAAAGIHPLLVDLTGPYPLGGFPAVDTVVWAASPDSVTPHRSLHVTGLGELLDALPGAPRLVFVSSTGVYGQADGAVVTEETPARPDRPAGIALLEAETCVATRCADRGVVLRLAGIYGPGRLPRLADLRTGRPLAGSPDTWLNLIHVDDAATIVALAADHPSPGRLYVISDGHPVRRGAWYAALAHAIAAPEPVWEPTTRRARGGDKRVDTTRMQRELAPLLRHPDPYAGLRACLAET